MENRMRRLSIDEFHRPTVCAVCGGILVYRGVGEYQCEDCEALEYDDYGKVRCYLEKHRGANVGEISSYTGVSHKSIRDMIKENRFEVIENRGGYIRCEMCGVNIRSGRLCSKCEMTYHRQVEEEERARRRSGVSGKSVPRGDATGSKRFTRER